MTRNNIVFIILAAGESKRMHSEQSKILHDIGGLSIIEHVFAAIKPISSNLLIVTSKILESIFKNYRIVIQEKPLGTGHALQTALPYIQDNVDDIIVVCGDMPLITSKTVLKLIESEADITLAVFKIDPKDCNYGRIIFDEHNIPQKIVEYKDLIKGCSDVAYAGLMKIKKNLAQELLPKLSQNNNSKEFYLTEIIELAKHAKKEVIFGEEEEFLGVNDRLDLSKAHTFLNKRWIKKLMLDGVTFESPQSTIISYDTKIDKDSVICSNIVIRPNVVIESGVVINSFSHLSNCTIKSGAVIGPFAHIREGSIIEEGAQIGNFVEVKKTKFGKNSKAKHLAYIGDADIGQNVNFGAGSITCNYNGKHKYKTIVKDCAFIGSNTSLIAPITLSKGAYIGAGSTVSCDIEENELFVVRGNEKRIKNWRK